MASRGKMVFVVGLGRLGVSLCEQLVSMGQYVVAVDRNPLRVEEMADSVDLCAQVDATDEDALVKAGAKEADIAVVTIGQNIEASILATTILKGLEIPYLVSRAQSSLHARVLARVGANKVIFPERDMGQKVAEQFIHPWLSRFSRLPGADFLIGEIAPSSEMIGKTLSELRFRSKYDAMVLLFKRDGAYFLPGADSIIKEEDRLLIAGQKDSLSTWVTELEEYNAKGGI